MESRNGLRAARCSLAGLCLALASCSQAPPLVMPEIAVPGAYRAGASPPHGVGLPRDAWWTLYGDAELDALQQRLSEGSPDLEAALARYRQSQAAYQAVRADLFPAASAAFGTQNARRSESMRGADASPESHSATLGLALGYEVDLWGRVSDRVRAGAALDEAARADLAAARLSLQAGLTDAFVTLRGIDRELQLLADTEAAYARELDLIRSRHDGGIASGLDVSRAQAQLEVTRSLKQQTRAQRALLEHAIATLVGVPASDFVIEPRLAELTLPEVPAGVPSELLLRRPDVAAARRRVAAANASVGVAKAAYFPSLTLTGTYGYQASDLGDLIGAPNVFWTIGPTLLLDLFDGGRRKAEIARATAVLDEAGALYRGVVLGAFQQVEDNLSLLEDYRIAAEAQAAAVAASERSVTLATNRYEAGAASYLEVVVSQAAMLQGRRTAEDLATRRLRASVQLVRALGGGYESGDAP
jgi:NodT family efflux transporter outer membrane factor (OMF) lipoprotein